jgi:hypothetical protein
MGAPRDTRSRWRTAGFKPENLAATLYPALGIPHNTDWHNIDGRPYELYRDAPIPGLT